jgi:hypothetical protein
MARRSESGLGSTPPFDALIYTRNRQWEKSPDRGKVFGARCPPGWMPI